MPRLASRHPLLIRLTHWANVPVLAVMVWSGLLIYWAYDPYQIQVGGVVLVKFFPQWLYEALDLEFGLATGMAYHFAFAWLFTINGLVYVGYLVRSGEWRALLPTRRSFGEAWHVVLHDLRLRREPLPPAKFNAAQRFAYTGVILMGAGSVLTGLAIWKPTQLGVADGGARRLPGRPAVALRPHDRLPPVRARAPGAGGEGRVEQLPGHGRRVRGGHPDRGAAR